MSFFSIIIPSYNRAAFLPKAIESILGQTYTDWELIIVDDGSTDATKEVVRSYKDERIQYIYQENAERSAARNNGISEAKGEFICFLDSDNVMESNRLELLYQFIGREINKEAVFYTDIQHVFPNTPEKNFIIQGSNFTFPIDYNDFIVIATPQLCVAKVILCEFKFNSSLSIGEDMELLFRIAKKYPLVYLNNNATVIEIEHEGRSVANRSHSSEKQLKALKLMYAEANDMISRKAKRAAYSAVFFNASYDYLLEGNLKGVKYLIQSIVKYPQSPQTKYKINLLLSFFFNKKKLKNMLLQQ